MNPTMSALLQASWFLVEAFAESKTDTLPATEATMGTINILCESEDVVAVLMSAIGTLLSIKSDTLDLEAPDERSDLAAFFRPKQVCSRLEFKSLDTVSLVNIEWEH